jgi:hypothetical protein
MKQIKVFFDQNKCNDWINEKQPDIVTIQISCATNINQQPQECIMVVYEE